MRKQLLPAVLVFLAMTVALGVVYPLAVTAVSQTAFRDRADGSLVRRDGEVVGSSLIGQNFIAPRYLHPRPSAAGASGYDGEASAASNLGPTNPDFLKTVAVRVAAYRAENGLPDTVRVPVDAVTTSGSGLDPHVSLANARLQADRIAGARGIDRSRVVTVIESHVDGRSLGVLGEDGVNVLGVNLALDALGPTR